jgi:anti-sigma28 factor (negative regulator of flagellin synthesis)
MRTALWSHESVRHEGHWRQAASAVAALPARHAAKRARQSQAGIRRRKVRAIRHRIREGTYDVEARLPLALDRIVADFRSGKCGS